jgi:hypothetical protein
LSNRPLSRTIGGHLQVKMVHLPANLSTNQSRFRTHQLLKVKQKNTSRVGQPEIIISPTWTASIHVSVYGSWLFPHRLGQSSCPPSRQIHSSGTSRLRPVGRWSRLDACGHPHRPFQGRLASVESRRRAVGHGPGGRPSFRDLMVVPVSTQKGFKAEGNRTKRDVQKRSSPSMICV